MGINYYDEYEGTGERGCCLCCEEAEEGCLCYDCKCSKCSEYDDYQKCTLARQWENSEGAVKLHQNGNDIFIQFDLPLANFKSIVQYLKDELFKYNDETKVWSWHDINPRSIPILKSKLKSWATVIEI